VSAELKSLCEEILRLDVAATKGWGRDGAWITGDVPLGRQPYGEIIGRFDITIFHGAILSRPGVPDQNEANAECAVRLRTLAPQLARAVLETLGEER